MTLCIITKNVANGSHTKLTLKVFKNTAYSVSIPRKLGYFVYVDHEMVEEVIRKACSKLGLSPPKNIRSNFFSPTDLTEFAVNCFLEQNFLSVWDSAELGRNVYYDAIVGNCSGLRSHFGILSNGDVVPCCRDYDGLLKLGNVGQSSIENILQGQIAADIRASLNQHKLPSQFCKRCRGGPTLLTSVAKQIGSLILHRGKSRRSRTSLT